MKEDIQVVNAMPEQNSFAMPAMILGVIGFVIGIIPFIGWFAIPLSVLAIIFGVLGLRVETNRGQAIAGIILGAALILWKFGFWFLLIIFSLIAEGM